MNYIGKFISNFKDFYNEINSATLTGAIDVIIIEQPDGTYLCSPFHVRFGKIGVLRSREKVVDIEINDRPVDIHMKLGDSGEAFFVEEVEDEHEIPQLWATSPLPPVPDIEEELRKMKLSSDAIKMNLIQLEDEANKFAQDTNTNKDRTASTDSVQSNEPRDTLAAVVDVANEVPSESSTLQDQTFPPEPSDSNLDSSKIKRKKRRRPSNKKRAKSKEIFIPSAVCASDKRDRTSMDESASTADEESPDKPEDIFQMDDDYGESEEDEGYPCTSHGLSRSVSLPLNPNKNACLDWPMRKMSSTFTGELHPFSDGDVTPPCSPTESRPASPKSDTEYETQKQIAMDIDVTEPSWGWGQLPNMPKTLQTSSQGQNGALTTAEDGTKVSQSDAAGAEKRSMLGGMLSFMRSTKKIRHQPETEGILLQSVESTSIDPEIASLYFQRYGSTALSQKVEIAASVKDEDTESGKGPSLPQSPHSVEGAIGGTDSDCEERQYLFGFYTEVAMSLCGGLLDPDVEISEERFKNSLITYDKFTENPSVLMNPNLVVKLGRKYYNWQAAAPMLASMMVFQRVLPEKTMNELVNEHMPKKKKSKSYSSWWSWGRSEGGSKTGTSMDAAETPSSENSESKTEADFQEASSKDSAMSSRTGSMETARIEISDNYWPESEASVAESLMRMEEPPSPNERSESLSKAATELVFTQASSPNSSTCTTPINVKTNVSHVKSELSVPVSADAESQNNPKEFEKPKVKKEKYKKSLRLTSEQITSLDLRRGSNEVVFSVTTAYQGTTRCKCDIYLWRYDDKIVISDIDGTITKSDVLGHILPMVGKDWAQLGVAQLFTKIHQNGYQFLYLSARAIGQARTTRDYLRSIRQGQVCLPDGPLLLSPTSLISALHREVIERKPEEFKISCLKDIQTLYPPYMGNPFYAGFGNKINDTWAYRAVAIPITRIFTINHRGELKQELIQTFQSSYSKLSDQVDHIFPPENCYLKINGVPAPSFTSSEEFSYFTYWRQPISALSDEEEFPE